MKAYRTMSKKEYEAFKKDAKALGFKMSITRSNCGMQQIMVRPSASDINVKFNEQQIAQLSAVIKAHNLSATSQAKTWHQLQNGFRGLMVAIS